jgi:hypothetical protein
MYVYYGNSAQTGYTYNSFCLFVKVGEPGKRSVRPELQPPLADSDEGSSHEPDSTHDYDYNEGFSSNDHRYRRDDHDEDNDDD